MAASSIISIDKKVFPILYYLAEPFAQLIGCIARNLTRNNIAWNVHDYVGLFPAIVFPELAKILYAKTGGYLTLDFAVAISESIPFR